MEDLQRNSGMICLQNLRLEFNGSEFFGGDKPNLVDLAAFGYVRSISPYPQFSQLEDHDAGMKWYNSVKSTLKV